MNLSDFNFKDLGKNLNSNNSFSNFVNNFINELSNYLQNLKDKEQNNQSVDSVYKEMQEYYDERERIMNTTNLEEDKTYVVSGIRNNAIKVVDIENGNEIKVYISTDSETLDKLNSNGIYDRIYQIDKSEFLNLNLTDNIIMKDNKLYSNSEKIEIKNNLAWRLLSDLYMGERETDGQRYEVADIKENKVYLTNADGTGGYFSIHKELYPDFEVGDIVQKNNRKYSKVE
jgi:hypothetical protein